MAKKTDQFGKTAADYARENAARGITFESSRPTGAPVSQAIDVTNLSKTDKAAVSATSGRAGQELGNLAASNQANAVTNQAILASPTPTQVQTNAPKPSNAPDTLSQPIDSRSPFSKAFFPTAEEGAARRLQSFGTESKLPAIALGGAILATGGAGLVAAGAGGAAAGTAAVAAPAIATEGSVAATSLISSTTATKLLLEAAAIFGITKQARVPNALKDAEGISNQAMSGADAAIAAVRKGEWTPEQGKFAIDQAEQNLNDLEKALKIASSTNLRVFLSYGGRLSADIQRKRIHLNDLRVSLNAAGAQAQLNQARAQYGLK